MHVMVTQGSNSQRAERGPGAWNGLVIWDSARTPKWMQTLQAGETSSDSWSISSLSGHDQQGVPSPFYMIILP